MSVTSQRNTLYHVIVTFVLNLNISHKSHSSFSYKFTHFTSKEKKSKEEKRTGLNKCRQTRRIANS